MAACSAAVGLVAPIHGCMGEHTLHMLSHHQRYSAVKGGGYCASAGRAVSLVVNNALRLVAVNVVGDAVLFLGKLGIAGACGGAAIALARLPYFSDAAAYPATYLSSAILPVALSVLVGFVVAQVCKKMVGCQSRLGWHVRHRVCPYSRAHIINECQGGYGGLRSSPLVDEYRPASQHPHAPISAACPQMFFAVYEMAIDTVLLSFCEDCEANGGEPRCAPPLLLEAIGEASNAGARKPSRSAGA